MKSVCKLLTFLSFLSLALAQECPPAPNYKTVKLPGRCPEIYYITNPYVPWTVQQQIVVFASLVNVCPGGCVVDNTLQIGENLFNSSVCCLQGDQESCFPYEIYSLDSEGVLIVPGRPELTAYTLDLGPDFGVFYNCVEDCNGEIVENVFVETNSAIVSKDLIDRIFGVLSVNHINLGNVTEISRTGCCALGYQ